LEVDNPEEDMPNPFAAPSNQPPQNDDPYNSHVPNPGEDIDSSQIGTQKYSDYMSYTPIKALAVGFVDWRIKARITKKYEKRTYKRENRTG
jgi:hypothetical protein